eukprot:jgi/Mesvir1/406/Mv11297-RA.1
MAATMASAALAPMSSAFTGLKKTSVAPSQWSQKTVQNGAVVKCMQVVNPFTNQKFETMSYLPPMTPAQIAKQVTYMVRNGDAPCIEFDSTGQVYRENNRGPCYYDGRYWTMYKLPMFGCTNPDQVLEEISNCKKEYPQAYIRVLGFNRTKQVQSSSIIVQKP